MKMNPLFTIPMAVVGACYGYDIYERRIREPIPQGVKRVFPTNENEERRRVIDLFARTVYGEARGEPRQGQVAIARVIMNRVELGRNSPKFRLRFGSTIEDVCLKPWQFSVWNHRTVGRPKEPDANYLATIRATRETDSIFDQICFICENMVNGAPRAADGFNPAPYAVYYHTIRVSPSWSRGVTPVARIGAHVFYNANQIA